MVSGGGIRKFSSLKGGASQKLKAEEVFTGKCTVQGKIGGGGVMQNFSMIIKKPPPPPYP